MKRFSKAALVLVSLAVTTSCGDDLAGSEIDPGQDKPVVQCQQDIVDQFSVCHDISTPIVSDGPFAVSSDFDLSACDSTSLGNVPLDGIYDVGGAFALDTCSDGYRLRGLGVGSYQSVGQMHRDDNGLLISTFARTTAESSFSWLGNN